MSAWDWCACGHPMLLHDVEEMDGSNPRCCAEGCDQRGCAAQITAAVGKPLTEAAVETALRIAAAELGVDEDAPPARLRSPQTAEQGSGVGPGANEAPEPFEAVQHHPQTPGGDGLGYGPCTGCGELWPCTPSRIPREDAV